MEWLAHSQKKHCELCKTAFRFTKLYDPQMPPSLPTSLFLRHVLGNISGVLIQWSRGLLLCLVWLGWLPWSMRAVWRFLFWLGDGGWALWLRSNIRHLEAETARATSQQRVHALMSGTSPASTGLGTQTRGLQSLPTVLAPLSQTLNMSSKQPSALGFLARLFFGFESSESDMPGNASIAGVTPTQSPYARQHPSFLSEVGLLNDLTRFPRLNSLVIDILEGQMITLLVVVAFILVFLIREWVVQQQPGPAIAEGLNAAFPPAPHIPDEPVEPLPPEEEERDRPLEPESSFQEQPREESPEGAEPLSPEDEERSNLQGGGTRMAGAAHPEASGDRSRPMARARLRRRPRPVVGEAADTRGRTECEPGVTRTPSPSKRHPYSTLREGSLERAIALRTTAESARDRSPLQRPGLPNRTSLSRATRVQRIIQEQIRAHPQDHWSADIFADVWRRAGGNPSEALRLIELEDHTTELQWIVDIIREPDFTESDSRAVTHQETAPVETSGADAHVVMAQTREGYEMAEPTHPEGKGKAPDHSLRSNSIPSAFIGSSHLRSPVATDDHPRNADLDVLRDEEPQTRRMESLYPNVSIPTFDLAARSSSLNWERTKASSSELHEESHIATTLNDNGPEASESEATSPLPRQLAHPAIDAHPFLDEGNENGPWSTSEVTESPGMQEAESPPAANGPQQSLSVTFHEPAAVENTLRRGLLDRVTDWLWGDVQVDPADLRPLGDDLEVNDAAHHEVMVEAAPLDQVAQDDHDVGQQGARGAANNPPDRLVEDMVDIEAIEDGEDFDGVMELIGMHGPIGGLIQNASFSAVLVSATVATAIWFPYVWGKVVLLILGNPVSLFVKLPLLWFSFAAELLVELALFFAGSFIHWTDLLVRLTLTPLSVALPIMTRYTGNTFIAHASQSIAEQSLDRTMRLVAAASIRVSGTDYPSLSIVSHEALYLTKARVATASTHLSDILSGVMASGSITTESVRAMALLEALTPASLGKTAKDLGQMGVQTWDAAVQMAPALWSPRALRGLLEFPARSEPLDPELAHWGPGDRVIAIVAGYCLFSLVGSLYVRRGRPFSHSEQGQKVEMILKQVLQQAGGVMKVILIISIEMIAFPLYCGLLLDVALLPLFEHATLASRLQFTAESPYTSVFVHWFIGTCYMFHFALFVSMCRRIMRPGVLYFIRDPDDPTFHPVRDVLERNVATQLRKITFSAIVYGALVIVCLGSVVWGLAISFEGVLPIHWSSNEPVLEFPVDLLVYNFLMPLAIRFAKPADGLHAMYTWWFRKCARQLRLTWFLFGERREDEEGHRVKRNWAGKLPRKVTGLRALARPSDDAPSFENSSDISFKHDGRYVRVPNSDQVRIPKGGNVFAEVDEKDEPIQSDSSVPPARSGHQSDLFTKLYVPPLFTCRIGFFIVLIWVFAAFTGLGITIVPLVLGRTVFAALIPNHLRMNDVYAFSIGIYLLGGMIYGVMNYSRGIAWLRHVCGAGQPEAWRRILDRATIYGVQLARIVYTYSAFVIFLPSLSALLTEMYIIIPLHTFFDADQQHIIYFIQDWTLGVLYIKLARRLILWHSHSRPASALRAITRHGWLNPDARLATRSFILPASVVMGGALIGPLFFGWLANRMYFGQGDAALQTLVYRYSYPAVMALCLWTVIAVALGMMMERWRRAVRDEVYLVGERLHNYGERRAGNAVSGHG
ncbi:MAG: hypothetical protein M1817_004510 [Caeruleum heppii]|nr:MAG: hypothetical protein M1817_004510 [Caeruleum heppii]